MKKNKTIEKEIIAIAISAISLTMLLAVFLVMIDKALDNLEVVECYKLQANAEKYKNFLYSPIINEGGFYITLLEKEMCEHHGIAVDAPVR